MNQPDEKHPPPGAKSPVDVTGQRAAWAAAMGIDFWVARKPLPGAAAGHLVVPLEPPGRPKARADILAASRQIKQPARSEQDAGIPPHASSAPPSAPSSPTSSPMSSAAATSRSNGKHTTAAREALRQARDELARESLRPQPKTIKAPSQASGQPGAKNSLQGFELACARIGTLLVVDEISRLAVTPSVYRNWLKAIALALQSLSMSADSLRTEVQRIAWPPDSGTGIPETSGDADAEKTAASEMLLAWLQRQFPLKDVERVLLMGNAASLLLGDSPAPGTVASVSRYGNLPALVTHGSCLLWREPLRKREFWQHLQNWQ